MKNGALNKVLSMLMSFLVLFSTISFTVDKHYCGDTLVETTIFKKPQGCGIEMQIPSTATCEVIKKSCCKDKQEVVSGQDELQYSLEKFNLNPTLFTVVFFHSYATLFEITVEHIPLPNDYPPPNIVKQLFKLDESYLI